MSVDGASIDNGAATRSSPVIPALEAAYFATAARLDQSRGRNNSPTVHRRQVGVVSEARATVSASDHKIEVSKREIYALAITPDESLIITGGADGALRKHALATDQQIGNTWRRHRAQINAVAMAPDGSEVASASDDGTVRRWRIVDGEQLGEPMAGHTGYAPALKGFHYCSSAYQNGFGRRNYGDDIAS